MNEQFIEDDVKIIKLLNIIFNKMNIDTKIIKGYDFFEVCSILSLNSNKINYLNNSDISDIVKNIFEIISSKNIWKIFVILYILSELSSDEIDIYYKYNIYTECKKQNINNWNEANITLKNSIVGLDFSNNINDEDVEIISDIFIGYLFIGIETMAYYGDQNFSLSESEYGINEFITGFGNCIEYNNSVSINFDIIESYYLLDTISDKFINLLAIFYRVDFKDHQNSDETYNWEKIAETVGSGML